MEAQVDNATKNRVAAQVLDSLIEQSLLVQEMKKGGLHKNPGHQHCTDCHKPHTWKFEQPDCLRCHASAGDHAGKKACAGCHAFGGAPLPPRAPTDGPPP